MSFKINLVKTAMKWTPNKMIMWVANSKLKGIAELTDLSFDLDARKVYAQAYLVGEEQPIELSLDGFAIVSDGESHHLIIQQGQSNRPWLHNLLARISGKEWKIPKIPQFQAYIDLVSELFNEENPAQEEGLVQGDELQENEFSERLE